MARPHSHLKHAIVSSIFVAGCSVTPAHPSHPSPAAGRTITAEMIAEYDVSTLWEVLKKTGSFRTARDDGFGEPNLRSRRGRTSFLLTSADIPRVILDGARVSDLRLLREIPARSIAWIQLLGGIEGTLQEGTNSGGGVIVIVTRSGT